MKHVYVLKDQHGEVVYVGETKQPNYRFKQHTRYPKCDRNSNGKFYGQNLTMEIVKSFVDPKDALAYEAKLKRQYGFEVTERKWIPYGPKKTRKLTIEQAREIRAKYIPRKYTQDMLAKEYGVSRIIIVGILNNKTYKE